MTIELRPERPRVTVRHNPDGTTQQVVIEWWRIVGATSFAREAHPSGRSGCRTQSPTDRSGIHAPGCLCTSFNRMPRWRPITVI